MSKRKTQGEFIKECTSLYGNKYDYSKVKYINSITKVCIVCPEHGEFWVTPNSFLNGKGCKLCGYKRISLSKRKNNEEFVRRAKIIHNDKYDYSKTEYVKNNIKVCIICPEHGEFWQTPSDHLSGCGCQKCKHYIRTKEEFVDEASRIHNGKYDYSKINYDKTKAKVCIICPEHGEFWQLPTNHLKGHGCPKCGYQHASEKLTYSNDEYKTKIKRIHGDRYDLTQVNYIKSVDKIDVICKKHGQFSIRAEKFLGGQGCPICGNIISYAEEKIFNFIIQTLNVNAVQHDRTTIYPYELDIYVPDYKVAFEYDGLKWHSEEFIEDKNYHLKKTKMCEERGIHLIHIFEDEWLSNEEIVKSKIKNILGKTDDMEKVYGRECCVSKISKGAAKTFLEKNHIQGYCRSSMHYGCFNDNNLVGVMTFKKCGVNEWELTRFATDINKRCVGVGGKIFKKFITDNNPKLVKSFADRRWTTVLKDNFYDRINFTKDKILNPDYRYVVRDKRVHKFNFRKQRLLKKYGETLTENMTEHEMANKLGFWRIYDCGLIKYKWIKEQ